MQAATRKAFACLPLEVARLCGTLAAVISETTVQAWDRLLEIFGSPVGSLLGRGGNDQVAIHSLRDPTLFLLTCLGQWLGQKCLVGVNHQRINTIQPHAQCSDT